jgi:hypothetical protein
LPGAEDASATVGLESRHLDARRHGDVRRLARVRIEPPYIAFIAFVSDAPQLAIDPVDDTDASRR